MSNEGSKISKGKILIADPILDEVYFRRGVILLSDHTDEGTIGFVLNKQIDEMERNHPHVESDKLVEMKKNKLLIKDEISRLNRLQWDYDHETIHGDE
jgi:putative AlgH/UPF0301 family transcriptional regulator